MGSARPAVYTVHTEQLVVALTAGGPSGQVDIERVPCPLERHAHIHEVIPTTSGHRQPVVSGPEDHIELDPSPVGREPDLVVSRTGQQPRVVDGVGGPVIASSELDPHP